MRRKNKGSSFDDWLREDGIHEEVTGADIKRLLAQQSEQAMKEKQLFKAEVARRMNTIRAALDRFPVRKPQERQHSWFPYSLRHSTTKPDLTTRTIEFRGSQAYITGRSKIETGISAHSQSGVQIAWVSSHGLFSA
jgi:hypothetical protein